MKPRFLFEDQHLVVLSKPAGLLSQGELSGDENLVDLLRVHFGRNYVGLVHRLDRNTSGLMVVAKRTKSAERLTRALQEGTLHRSYLAWVQGDPGAAFRWADRLIKDESSNRVRVVRDGGKLSTLSGKRRERLSIHGETISLIELTLETGRSHQIRVQASSRNHPLLGDSKYGNRLPTGLRGFDRPLLHSAHLEFPHPMSGEILRFDDPLPDDMLLTSGGPATNGAP